MARNESILLVVVSFFRLKLAARNVEESLEALHTTYVRTLGVSLLSQPLMKQTLHKETRFTLSSLRVPTVLLAQKIVISG